MNRRNKAFLIVISILLIIGLFAGGLYLKSIGDYKAKVAALTFDESLFVAANRMYYPIVIPASCLVYSNG